MGRFVLVLILLQLLVHALASSSALQQETLISGTTIESVSLRHALAHASGGSRGGRPGESGGSSGTRMPYAQGGTTMIPVYAAGAANNHRPSHRGAASSSRADACSCALIAAATLIFLRIGAGLGLG